ncbi:cupin domain-containing protein [Oricola indica]|uniref:cupin domain-containing protein n=1 Tax=Oricola indica TaxID=2872591 RepID=UPI003CCC332D
MDLPDFIQTLDAIDLPIDEETVSTNAIQSDKGLMVIFTIHQDVSLPPHSHRGQWGTVLEGSMELTIGGETRIYRPGDSYNIPSGVEHSARLPAGTKVLDLFEEPDRYQLKR